MENQITESFAKSIIECNKDSFIDITELGIDSIISNPLIQKIPVLKVICGAVDTFVAIKEVFMIKKTIRFLNYINNHIGNNEQFEKYKEELKTNNKKLMSELERILIIIDRSNDETKMDILGNLFINFISDKISWEDFIELNTIMENIFVRDFKELELIYKNGGIITMNQITDNISFKRLKNQVLIDDIPKSRRNTNGSISHFYEDYDYQITDLGEKLYRFGVEK